MHAPPRAARPTLRITEAFALGGIVVLGAVLRCLRLADQSLWEDEAASVVYAKLPWRELWAAGFNPGNPPGYFALLKGWLALVGDDDLRLRLLPLLCGLATIVAVYALTRRVTASPWLALAPAAWLAMAPEHVYFSQELRAYSLLGLLTVTGTHALLHATATGSIRAWVLYLVMAGPLPYLHFQGFFVLFGQGLVVCWALWRRHGTAHRKAVTALALLALAVTPCVTRYLAPGLLSPGGYHFWQGHVSPLRVAGLLATYSVGTRWLWQLEPLAPLVGGAGVALGVLILAAPAVAVLRRRQRQAEGVPLLLMLYGSVLAFVLVSAWVPVWEPKYLLAFQPLFLVTLALSLNVLPGPLTRTFGALVIPALCLPGLWHDYRYPPRPDYRGTAAHVLANTPADAPVCVYRFAYRSIERYLGDARLVVHAHEPEPLAALLTQLVRHHPQVMVVLSRSQISPEHRVEVEVALEAAGVPVSRTPLHRVEVVTLGRGP